MKATSSGIFFVIVGVLFLVFSTSAQVPSTPAERILPGISTGKVTGRVVFEDSGQPVRNVIVKLAPSEPRRDLRSRVTRSDQNGEFVFNDVVPGKYIAEPEADGLLRKSDYAERNLPGDSPAVAGLKPPNEVFLLSANEEAVVTVKARRGGAIAGRVTFTDGAPALQVEVEAISKLNGRLVRIGKSAKTDERGDFRVAGLPGGQYLLRITLPLRHTSREVTVWDADGQLAKPMVSSYYAGNGQGPQATEINVEPGKTTDGIDARLEPRKLFSLTGRVLRRSNDSPVESAVVFIQLVSTTDGPFTPAVVVTKATGGFSFFNLPAGKYRIKVSYTDADEKLGAGRQSERFAVVQENVELKSQSVDDLQIRIPTASSIEGTLVVNGVERFDNAGRLRFSPTMRNVGSGEYFGITVTPATPDGGQAPNAAAIRVERLPPGRYLLQLPAPFGFNVKSATIGDRDVLNKPIEIGEGERLTDLRIVLTDDFGRVTAKVDGCDTSRMTVFLVPAGTTLSDDRDLDKVIRITANGGPYFSAPVPPGDYMLAVFESAAKPDSGPGARPLFAKALKKAIKISVKSRENTAAELKAKCQ